jgi:hypothetical protein
MLLTLQEVLELRTAKGSRCRGPRPRRTKEELEMLQKDENATHRHFISMDMMQHFGETFDDFTLLHYDDEYARILRRFGNIAFT